ncbi:type II toxin-antitoxin system VapC family toxin [Candidatus Woesebacteria bacterium]|nr:type II toxin-antitoxin system VapC family toxin [Candidatus Woesebacteria bacterium]
MQSKSKAIIVDANIVLRFLLNDHPQLSQKAKAIITKSTIFIDETVIAEVIWVLESFYELKKTDIVKNMSIFISFKHIESENKERIMQALNYYSLYNISYIDAWLLALRKDKKTTLATFDKTLQTLAQKKKI